MSLKTTPYNQIPLHFLVEDEAPLSTQLVEFRINEQDGELDRVEITVMIAPETYARIGAEGLFHLTADVRGPGSNRAFREDAAIELELRLHPGLLTVLADEADSLDSLDTALIDLSDQDAEHALLLQDSWYVVRVKQEDLLPPELQGPGRSIKSGYNTTWLETLVKDDGGSTAMSTLIEAMEGDGWNWAQGADKTMVMSRYVADDHLRWNIYAQIRAEESFCLVYSLCPLSIASDEVSKVVEFITRANTDLPIGNFEINYDTREVRFKTSLDYEGTRLTTTLVRQLLRANASMVERYLPGLKALVEEGTNIMEALRLAED